MTLEADVGLGARRPFPRRIEERRFENIVVSKPQPSRVTSGDGARQVGGHPSALIPFKQKRTG